MGTSNSFPGPGNNTPLVPDWLDPDGPQLPGMPGDQPQPAPIPPNKEPQPDPQSPDREPQPEPETPPTSPPTTQPPPNRFTTARTNLSRFASSGGGDSISLGRGISHYVTTSSGGSRQAARRMGSSRKVGGTLLGFLRDTIERGVEKALGALQLNSLAGRPIDEIFLGMMGYICPDGGNVDEGIARDAFIETIADLAENGITDLDALNPSQMQTVFELYTTHSIENRLFNDVGTKIIQFPADARAALQIQYQVHDFIHRGVSDAISATRDALLSLTQSSIQRFVDQIYVTAFELLRNLGAMEGEEL
ncbi:MAG: Qat anti-phage system associated protein QatB [Bellilinea sp.]